MLSYALFNDLYRLRACDTNGSMVANNSFATNSINSIKFTYSIAYVLFPTVISGNTCTLGQE